VYRITIRPSKSKLKKLKKPTVVFDRVFWFNYLCLNKRIHFFLWCNSPTQARTASFVKLLDYSQWHTTVGRSPLDEGSACRKDLHLTTLKTHKKTDIHATSGIILFYSICTSSVPVSLSSLSYILSFFCLYNTQHKYPCPWRDSNSQSQQPSDCRSSP
jgi:hypothetical protein